MAVFEKRKVLGLLRSVRIFWSVEAGVIHGDTPRRAAPKNDAKGQKTSELSGALTTARNPGPARGSATDLLWVFSASRSGSTWLTDMMGSLPGWMTWKEPSLGELFGEFAAKKSYNRHHHVFGGNEATWRGPLRSFVLEMAAAKFPELSTGTGLVIKESGSAVGAPLLMRALPDSPMVVLLRDPRDVAASAIDAQSEGGWFRRVRREKGAPIHKDAASSAFTKQKATNYARQLGRALEAFEAHPGPKALVRYEDLRRDGFAELRRLYTELRLPVEDAELARVVEEHAWENIPEEKKGEGKFYRKASPGGWRDDLTPQQVEIVEKATAPLLKEFYPQ